jgi:serine protease inhibitor
MSATENPTIVNLTFDRPFMVSLVDSSGAILLLGQVDDPTATGG